MEATFPGVKIRYANQPVHFPQDNTNYWCDHEQFFLRIPGVAVYHVRAPTNTITIEPDPMLTQPQLINTWLNGTVLAYLLQYHNYLVLHGSAIVVGDEAVIFSGDSGAGKSTIAMAMQAGGYPFITDDLVVIRCNDGAMEIMPTFARSKLWVDSLAQLGKTSEGLHMVLNKLDKYEVPVQSVWATPIKIAKLFELNPCSEKTDVITASKLTGFDAIKLLIKNTYRYTMLNPLGKLDLHLQQINQLASTIEIHKVTRPNHRFQINDLVRFIEAYWDTK